MKVLSGFVAGVAGLAYLAFMGLTLIAVGAIFSALPVVLGLAIYRWVF